MFLTDMALYMSLSVNEVGVSLVFLMILISQLSLLSQKNEIPKEGFVRLMRGIVGDHMLKLAVIKTQSQVSTNYF